jgi:hypothetical protein
MVDKSPFSGLKLAWANELKVNKVKQIAKAIRGRILNFIKGIYNGFWQP